MTDSESRASQSPVWELQEYDDNPSLSCSTCAGSVPAARECLACKASFCQACAASHTQQLERRHHRLVPLSQHVLCPKHLQENLLYCFECGTTCCVACSEFSTRHKGHRVWDIQSAEETLRPALRDITLTLTSMASKLSEKCRSYEEQKRSIICVRDTLKVKMREKVGRLVGVMNAAVERVGEELDVAQKTAVADAEKELESIGKNLAVLALLRREHDKRLEVGELYPRLKTIQNCRERQLGSRELALPQGTVRRCREFLETVEFITDIQSYRDGVYLDHRWECRKCHNKNFPKSAICKKCNTTNHLLSSLLAGLSA